MNIYFLGTQDCIHNTRVAFLDGKSEKATVIKEVFENEFPDEWKQILGSQDIILNDTINKSILENINKKLSHLLPIANDPKGNHSIEFNGVIFKISKLSGFFREIYALHNLSSLLLFIRKHNCPLYLININLMEDSDNRYTFDVVSRFQGIISNKNLKSTIDNYLNKNKIHHIFKIKPEVCIADLIKNNFLFIETKDNIDYYFLTSKGALIKSKPIN